MRQLSGPKIYKILPCWKDEAEVEVLLLRGGSSAAATRPRFARDESPATRRCTPAAMRRPSAARGDGGIGGGLASDGVREGEMLPAS